MASSVPPAAPDAQPPTEILRRAAALMRERAEAARQFLDDQGRDWWSPEVLVDAFTAWTGEESGQVIWGVDRDANHLASWHPVVALAVADWLDDTAENLDLQSPGGALREQWDVRVHIAGYKALAVARAYLREGA